MTTQLSSRSQLKRQAIIDAAKTAFKEYGVQATSMDKLAELANVSKRTVYNHFDSKEALVMHLVSDLWNKAVVDIEFDYQTDQTVQEQLTNWIQHEISLVCTREFIDLSRVAIGHLFYSIETLRHEMEKLACQSTKLQDWLKSAVDNNQLEIDDIEYASFQLHSLIEGSCYWPQLVGCKELLTKQEQIFVAHETAKMFLARYAK